MASKGLKNTDGSLPMCHGRNGWRKKKDRPEDDQMIFKLKELLIERKAPLMLSRRRSLNFKYCEVVTLFNGVSKKRYVVPEFEHPEKLKNFPTNFDKIYSFGIHELRSQIGMKFTCANVIRTEGRVQLHLCFNPSPTMKRRQDIAVDEAVEEERTLSPSLSAEEHPDVVKSSDDGYTTAAHADAPDQACSDEDTRVEQKPLPTGSVVTRKFNGADVKDFHMVKSSSTQTESEQEVAEVATTQPLSRAVEKETISVSKVSSHLHRTMQIARLREREHFMRARSYLAFFSKFSEFGYKGETKLSVGNQLHLAGLPIDPVELREVYDEALKDLFTKAEIDHDLDCCYAMIQTERTMYLDKASDSVKKRYGRPSGDPVPVAHHGYATRPGRCDPDICILM